MKKILIKNISVILVLILSFSMVSATPAVEAKTTKTSAAVSKVLESRFLNMLNHNFVYNEDFDYIDSIVNNSTIPLLNMRDPLNEEFIEEKFVREYVYNMYGILIDDFSEINSDLPKLDGYIYVLPRGYSEYKHKIASVTLNEDGSYTVTTDVSIASHDDESLKLKAETLFVKNPSSQFGYNIIYSNLTEKTYTL